MNGKLETKGLIILYECNRWKRLECGLQNIAAFVIQAQ